jgi:putative cardiolipin synthase
LLKSHRLPPAGTFERKASFAQAPDGRSVLDRLLAADLEAGRGLSGFRLLAVGMEAFLMRVALAESARRTLDLQYYIYREDDTGAYLSQALLKAADRGVHVRLLVDDLNLMRREDDVTALDAHPHIEVRIFNPFASRREGRWGRLLSFLADPARLNRRMHNKSFIADNLCSVVGGRNIGDEYFDASRDFGFGDLDVLAVGPVTREISASFDLYWNSDFAYPLAVLRKRAGMRQAAARLWMERVRGRLGRHFVRMGKSDYATRVLETDLAAQLTARHLLLEWAQSRVLVDPPEKIVEPPGPAQALPYGQLLALAEQARREVILVSPYFVPGAAGIEALQRLRDRGVRVRILTNSLASTDVAAVHAGYRRYRPAMLAMGIELCELKPIVPAGRRMRRRVMFGSARASLHAKTFVFDRERVVVGSMNLDPRSVYLNTEMGLLIESPKLAGDIAESFDELVEPDYSYRLAREAATGAVRWHAVEQGADIEHFSDPGVSIWRRLAVIILGWLPIERQL